MKNKIAVDYTKKGFDGLQTKLFDSRDHAEKWVDSNQEILFWSRIRVDEATSTKPKLIVPEDEDLSSYTKIDGILQTYFETGMECLGLILCYQNKLGPANPNFDPTKPESESNFKLYKSHAEIVFLGSGDILQVQGQPKLMLIQDRQFAFDDLYRLSLYPQGFSREELLKLFTKETVIATVWVKKET